jgi:hypothetical protein
MYTYAIDTLIACMIQPPVDYQILQYVPYIIIALVILIVWKPGTLTRKEVIEADK